MCIQKEKVRSHLVLEKLLGLLEALFVCLLKSVFPPSMGEIQFDFTLYIKQTILQMCNIPAVKRHLNIVQFLLECKNKLCISYIQCCWLKTNTFHKLDALLQCTYSPGRIQELLRQGTLCIKFTA